MSRLLLPLLLGSAGLLLLSSGSGARAHGLESSLQRLGNLSAGLESHYSSGLPAADAKVRLLVPGAEPIALGRTDAAGKLTFQLPAQAHADWEIQIEAGPGHKDYLELPPSRPQSAAAISHSETGPFVALRHLGSAGLLGLLGAAAGLLMCRQRP
jgi:nickel transport protein